MPWLQKMAGVGKSTCAVNNAHSSRLNICEHVASSTIYDGVFIFSDQACFQILMSRRKPENRDSKAI